MKGLMVKDVMTHLVVALGPRDTIEQAGLRLLSNRISGTPVVEEGKLVGIVSETDLIQTYAQAARGTPFSGSPNRLMSLPPGASAKDVSNTTVGDVMTLDVVSIPPEASVWEAASLMNRRRVRRLPVVDADSYVVGVLTRSDLVRAMAVLAS
jgi:CBS domain-containing protein